MHAAELTPQDIAENGVVKIADEVEVDESRQAWQVRYADAIATTGAIPIEGVRVPFLSLEMLIKKQDHLPRAGSRGFGAAARPAGAETPARRRGDRKRIVSLSHVPSLFPLFRAEEPGSRQRETRKVGFFD